MGAKLLALRKKKGYRQEDISAALGLSRVSVINIEAGRQSMTLEVLIKCCAIFSCSPAKFLPPVPAIQVKERPRQRAKKRKLPKPRKVSKKRAVVNAKFTWV